MTKFARSSQATFVNVRATEICPECGQTTSRSNYRVDALRGKTYVICERCEHVLPPRRK